MSDGCQFHEFSIRIANCNEMLQDDSKQLTDIVMYGGGPAGFDLEHIAQKLFLVGGSFSDTKKVLKLYGEQLFSRIFQKDLVKTLLFISLEFTIYRF